MHLLTSRPQLSEVPFTRQIQKRKALLILRFCPSISKKMEVMSEFHLDPIHSFLLLPHNNLPTSFVISLFHSQMPLPQRQLIKIRYLSGRSSNAFALDLKGFFSSWTISCKAEMGGGGWMCILTIFTPEVGAKEK